MGPLHKTISTDLAKIHSDVVATSTHLYASGEKTVNGDETNTGSWVCDRTDAPGQHSNSHANAAEANPEAERQRAAYWSHIPGIEIYDDQRETLAERTRKRNHDGTDSSSYERAPHFPIAESDREERLHVLADQALTAASHAYGNHNTEQFTEAAAANVLDAKEQTVDDDAKEDGNPPSHLIPHHGPPQQRSKREHPACASW